MRRLLGARRVRENKIAAGGAVSARLRISNVPIGRVALCRVLRVVGASIDRSYGAGRPLRPRTLGRLCLRPGLEPGGFDRPELRCGSSAAS